ncbi:MAG TPA: type VI secretion system tube protein Hcp [Chitinophagaceae bacterium]|nr:type VI secretion system tube protein Hcp [Chitinophagaceae bacterium]
MKHVFTLLLACIAFVNQSFAQDVVIKLVDAQGNQIMGELAGPGRNGYLAITSIGQENINCTDITGAMCSAKPGHFIFNTLDNKAMNGLRKALFTSEHLSLVEITFRRSGGTQEEYLRIRMENVLVKNLRDAYTDSMLNVVTHQVELQAGKIGWYHSAMGSVINKFGWNYIQNVEWPL